jgi:hypothetical protein
MLIKPMETPEYSLVVSDVSRLRDCSASRFSRAVSNNNP